MYVQEWAISEILVKNMFSANMTIDLCSLTCKHGRSLSAHFAILKNAVIALVIVYHTLFHIPQRRILKTLIV